MKTETIQPLNSRLTKTAFTLAETLIVIGIIGVVAALTLPNLNHATGDKEKVTRVKKIYSALTDAVDRAQVVYGDFDTWFTDLQNQNGYIHSSNYATANERFAKRVTEFMKVTKDCGIEDSTKYCFNPDDNIYYDYGYSVILSDGTALLFISINTDQHTILVDLDGTKKGKNKYANDIFAFDIYRQSAEYRTKNTLYPGGWTLWSKTGFIDGCLGQHYCTDWVVRNENLDYLKCPEDLNWDTKTSCK